MKRTIVYIDGYNLYNRLLRRTAFKWLDLMSFATALLRPDHAILTIRYFTSRVLPYPPDPMAVDRQKIYLQAIGTLPNVEIVEGVYTRRKTCLPFASQPCRSCERVPRHFARVYKFEEKRTDVALASAMLVDASLDRADSLVVISGDSDFIPAIMAVRENFHKQVLVFDPSENFSEHLKIVASYYKNIPRDLPARCQLPDEIPVGTHGRMLHCPEAWRFGLNL